MREEFGFKGGRKDMPSPILDVFLSRLLDLISTGPRLIEIS